MRYYAADTQPRKHDADLTAHDRVEICLDIDRDYGSYWKLAVDSRGFTAESCFGDATWNPTWYVASGSDGQFWTFEAAIPLAELTPKAPKSATSGPSASSGSFPTSASNPSPSQRAFPSGERRLG